MVYILIREQCIYLFRSVNNGVGVTVKSEGPEVSKSACRPCVNAGRIRHGRKDKVHTYSFWWSYVNSLPAGCPDFLQHAGKSAPRRRGKSKNAFESSLEIITKVLG